MTEGGMRYFVNSVRLFTRDVGQAVNFYMDTVGFKLVQVEDTHAVFEVGGVNWIVESVEDDDAEGQALIGRFMGVSLSSPDILATFDILSDRGVEFLGPPARQDWGGYLAHFLDPDRNIISLVGKTER